MNNNGHRKRRIPRTQRDYWWCCAVDRVTGRPMVQGPHNREDGARQWGFEHMGDTEFEVLAFPTINKMAARDYYKNVLVERSKDISVVFKRAKYK